jgi:hypothetical protein
MGGERALSSWPGFVPAIHVFLAVMSKEVDARHKAGHDELSSSKTG